MNAIVIATGYAPQLQALTSNIPAPLLPLIDRPFIQHIVENLIEQGIVHFDFVLSHLPEKIETSLGDGTRWGAHFKYHLARDPERPYDVLKSLSRCASPVLFVHADYLPKCDLTSTTLLPGEEVKHIVIQNDARGNFPSWSGWSCVAPEVLNHIPDGLNRTGFEDYLNSLTSFHPVIADCFFRQQTPADLLVNQQKVLTQQSPNVFLSGRQNDPGVWLSRNVNLHPSARIVPPVYISENCKISKGVEIGPNVCLGPNTFLDENSTLNQAMVFSGSYVGEGLAIENAIVDRHQFFHVELETMVFVGDNFILGSLSQTRITAGFARFFSRVIAGLGLLMMAPVLGLTAFLMALFRRGPVVFKRKIVALPIASERGLKHTVFLPSFIDKDSHPPKFFSGMRDFLLRFLPGLWAVFSGHLRFVGLDPRTPEEMASLFDSEWKSFYMNAHCGLISETLITFGQTPSVEERFAAETYYVAKAGLKHNFYLAFRYLIHILNPFSKLA